MFAAQSRASPERVTFFLVPRFSMIALVGAIDALRLANRISGEPLYAWRTVTETGAPAEASNGLCVNVDGAIGDDVAHPCIVVVSGIDAQLFRSDTTIAWLRRQARRGAELGALCTGTLVLARAGLLDGRRCTVHWENLVSLRETYPDLHVTAELFEVDGDRFTCAGGIAAVDLMLHAIALRHGPDLSAAVSEQFVYHRMRDAHDGQKVPLRTRLGVSHPKLVEVISLMETHQEEPMQREALADRVGLSRRQLERLFRKYLGTTPGHYYLAMRLERARLLLLQTAMPIIDVALACGFVSASHFSKCYREQYGRTPRDERRAAEIGRSFPRDVAI